MTNIEPLVQALLYEGYILYPYRPTALKNQHRWTFGGLVPRTYSEASDNCEKWFFQAECIVMADVGAALDISVRFLHPLICSEHGCSSRQEVTERVVDVSGVRLETFPETIQRQEFAFPDVVGERIQQAIEGHVEVSVKKVIESVYRVTVCVKNTTPLDATSRLTRDDALLRSLASAHAILRVHNGDFVSLLEPPEEFHNEATLCQNIGVWPVLVGDSGQRDTMLASPIILYDYPQIAPESGGDFFDGTEIDEMLALRILTLTDDEKLAMSSGDSRARNLLERVESLNDEQMARLHGTVRGSTVLGPGDQVRLRPRGRADAFDILLVGKIATIVGVERDFEGVSYYTVTVDEDPGRDLGATGQPGHRFFFRADEVEPLDSRLRLRVNPNTARRILVAGIGNIFRGDDAFGVEVVRRYRTRTIPPNVRAIDFGTNGTSLAYEISDGYDVVILVDATHRDGKPGMLYTLEPQLSEIDDSPAILGTHGIDLPASFRLARSLGGPFPRLLVIGCEPADLGTEDEGKMGLSEPVLASLYDAVLRLEALVAEVDGA